MDCTRRSRSAAKPKHASTSSCVSCGNSAKRSASDWPVARKPSTSPTVMRVPRTHGLPNRTSGSVVIRTNNSMCLSLSANRLPPVDFGRSLSLRNAANEFAETVSTFATPQPLLLSIDVPTQRFTNERAARASKAMAMMVDFGEKRCIHAQRDANHAAHSTTVTP